MGARRLFHETMHVGIAALSFFLAITVFRFLERELDPINSVPTGLPEAARTGFLEIRKEVRRERGTIRILHSPLLRRSFPGFCFVRADLAVQYWGNARVRPIFVYAISLNGGPTHQFRCQYSDTPRRIGRFLVDEEFRIRSKADAELLQRILWELWPTDRRAGVEARSERREWVIGGRGGCTVTVDADGFVTRIE